MRRDEFASARHRVGRRSAKAVGDGALVRITAFFALLAR